MKILLVDRNLGFAHERFPIYETPLKDRGHTVKAVGSISDLMESDGLESYDLAIVHPTPDDARILRG